MTAQKRKSKVITFRASLEEYEAVAKSSLESGGSISAFARAAVIERVHLTGGRPISISGDLMSLGNALSELDGRPRALGLAPHRARRIPREASSKIRRLLGNAEGSGKAAEHY